MGGGGVGNGKLGGMAVFGLLDVVDSGSGGGGKVDVVDSGSGGRGKVDVAGWGSGGEGKVDVWVEWISGLGASKKLGNSIRLSEEISDLWLEDIAEDPDQKNNGGDEDGSDPGTSQLIVRSRSREGTDRLCVHFIGYDWHRFRVREIDRKA
ncbi:MAG: hypothetical protein Q9228_003276 [Teloschistes exilis]